MLALADDAALARLVIAATAANAAARRAHEIEITNVRITDRAGRAYRAAGGGPGRPNRVKGTTPEKLAATAINSGREAFR
jgi:hypothetical protein